jgi:thiamine pyrophosphate-dependent acetolactate synthase large subunit-like protein
MLMILNKIKQALTRCFEGRPGPSLLDIPTNIQNSIINEEVFKLILNLLLLMI